MNTSSELKQEVKTLLRTGKEKARIGSEMATVLGFKDDRPIRLAIRELIAEGLPVAASGKGYFIASSIDEATEYMRNLKGRLVEDAYRRRDFKLASREILQPYQMALI